MLGPLYCPREYGSNPFSDLEEKMSVALGRDLYGELIRCLQVPRPRDCPSDVLGPIRLAHAQARDTVGCLPSAYEPICLGKTVHH